MLLRFFLISPAQHTASVERMGTRAELSEAVFREVGLSKEDSARLVKDVLAAMSDALVAGEPVKISGFGSLSVRQKGRRIGRNPITGVEVMIEPRRVLNFRPSRLLRDKVEPISNAEHGE